MNPAWVSQRPPSEHGFPMAQDFGSLELLNFGSAFWRCRRRCMLRRFL